MYRPSNRAVWLDHTSWSMRVHLGGLEPAWNQYLRGAIFRLAGSPAGALVSRRILPGNLGRPEGVSRYLLEGDFTAA